MANENWRHVFDEAIRLTEISDGVYRGGTSPAYANMVGPFGGFLAATLLKSVWDHPARQGEPVALTVNFAAPVADGDFEVTATTARTNRSTQHWLIQLLQNDEIAITASAVFATRRETWSVTDAVFPAPPAAAEIAKSSLASVPAFWRNYDIRTIRGGVMPFGTAEDQETKDSVSLQWIRDEPARPIDFFSLTAMCDVFTPRIFIRRNRRVPIGTVSLTVYFHADFSTLQEHGEREVLGQAGALRFSNGYFDQAAAIWTPEGELLATSAQLVYFRE
jgi:acyl-CoA thioesterase